MEVDVGGVEVNLAGNLESKLKSNLVIVVGILCLCLCLFVVVHK